MSVEHIPLQSWILPITANDWYEEREPFNLASYHSDQMIKPEFTIAVVNRHHRLIGTIGYREILRELLETDSHVIQSLWPPFIFVHKSHQSWIKSLESVPSIPAGLLMCPSPLILTPPWDFWRALNALTVSLNEVLWLVDERKIPHGKITMSTLSLHPAWGRLTSYDGP